MSTSDNTEESRFPFGTILATVVWIALVLTSSYLIFNFQVGRGLPHEAQHHPLTTEQIVAILNAIAWPLLALALSVPLFLFLSRLGPGILHRLMLVRDELRQVPSHIEEMRLLSASFAALQRKYEDTRQLLMDATDQIDTLSAQIASSNAARKQGPGVSEASVASGDTSELASELFSHYESVKDLFYRLRDEYQRVFNKDVRLVRGRLSPDSVVCYKDGGLVSEELADYMIATIRLEARTRPTSRDNLTKNSLVELQKKMEAVDSEIRKLQTQDP